MGNYALAYLLALLTGLCLLLERPRATPALRLLGFCALAGMLVLKRKFPVELDVVGPMLVLLGALQIAAVVFLFQDKARVPGLAFTAV